MSSLQDNLDGLFIDLVNTVSEGVLILNHDLKIIFANRSFYKMFKTSSKNTENISIFELDNNQWDVPGLRDVLNRIIPDKKEINDFEIEADFSRLGKKIMIINAREVVDRTNRNRLIFLAINDVTQNRKLYEATLHSAKLSAVGELSAGIAHGINSPLTGIYNFLHVYYKTEKDSEKKKELKLMVDACMYISEIIKNLTSFSNRSEFSFSELNIVDVIESTLVFIEKQLLVKNIKVIRDFPGGVINVKGNKSYLQCVFLNILMNSKEAIDIDGKIEIKLRQKDNRIIIQIIDDGVGIPKQDLSNMFTPFFTTKKKNQHVGLGLSSAYGIIKAHKGNITIKSNKGTEVIITLPLAK